jgi:hypothetical protein
MSLADPASRPPAEPAGAPYSDTCSVEQIGPDHRMPACCSVMRAAMRGGDQIVHAPPSGQGATLRIRDQLPR